MGILLPKEALSKMNAAKGALKRFSILNHAVASLAERRRCGAIFDRLATP